MGMCIHRGGWEETHPAVSKGDPLEMGQNAGMRGERITARGPAS